jgi:hypothetical protein
MPSLEGAPIITSAAQVRSQRCQIFAAIEHVVTAQLFEVLFISLKVNVTFSSLGADSLDSILQVDLRQFRKFPIQENLACLLVYNFDGEWT